MASREFLAEILGPEGADRLIAACGGEALYVPRQRSVDVSVRRSQILHLHDQGMGASEIAGIVGRSPQLVRLVLRQAEQASTFEAHGENKIDQRKQFT